MNSREAKKVACQAVVRLVDRALDDASEDGYRSVFGYLSPGDSEKAASALRLIRDEMRRRGQPAPWKPRKAHRPLLLAEADQA